MDNMLYDILRVSMASLDRAICNGDNKRIRIEYDHLHNIHEYMRRDGTEGVGLYLKVDQPLYIERMDRDFPGWRETELTGKILPAMWEKLQSLL